MAADSYETAKATWLARDYGPAFLLMQPLAEQGDTRAQASLALMYAKGQGVPRDAQKSIAWYTRAARAGLPQAQYDLGTKYFRGEDVPRAADKAVYWWQQAARSGLPEAQYDLGLAYERGIGTARDARQALDWYRAAAKQGHGLAQYALGVAYANAQGTRRDLQQALQWFEAAAAHDIASAQYNLGLMLELGRGTHQDIAQAIRWYRSAARLGLAEARQRLANFGLEVPAPERGKMTVAEIAPARTPSGTIHQHAWILRQDPKAYTLQLASGEDEAAIRKLLKRLSTLGETAYFKQIRADGTARYIALLGVFPSYQDAERVLQQRPETLSKAHPWARHFAGIQHRLQSP